jgi:hypothetical protein
MPDPEELVRKEVHQVVVGREHEQYDLGLTWSDYFAMYIAIVKTLLPFVLLIAIVYSLFIYFFVEVWLK